MKSYVSIFLMVFLAVFIFTGCPEPEKTNTPVTGVTLDKFSTALQVGGTVQLTATVLPNNASNKAVIWSSSEPLIASVENGLVTAVAGGISTITATTKDGNKTASCVVTVTAGAVVPVESISISRTGTVQGSSIIKGATMDLRATILPANATNRTVAWSSSNTSIATVAPNENVTILATITAVTTGNATITAEVDGKNATFDVTVTDANVSVTGVSLDKSTADLTVGGATIVLKAAVAPANATNQTVTWDSSEPSIASVTSSGVVTAVANGTANITARTVDGNYSASCAVTVTGGADPRNYTKIEGDTLVHYTPPLKGVGYYGSQQGTDNTDDSYTFNGTAGAWAGGGAQYNFPTPKTVDTWKIADYQIVEIHLKVISGSVTVGVKKSGGNNDLKPIPDGASGITFNAATNGGILTFKTVVGEAGSGIGFQRNTGGPATVAVEKVVFSKTPIYTITFSGGTNTGMATIDPIKIPDGRTVNYFGSYNMPSKPKWAGHTFTGWYNTTESKDFDDTAPITKNLTLTAKWEDGDPPPVDMRLNLDPTSWGTLPPNAANQSGGWTWPSDYAQASYNSEDKKLTLTFNGNNRQRAIIPLSTEQIEELMDTAETSVTFKIVGTVKNENGTDSTAEFRLHLGNPSSTGTWNGTTTGSQDALKDHLVENATFANKTKPLLSWFMIQAMYKKDGSDTVQSGFPKVIITIESITIDIGNTQ